MKDKDIEMIYLKKLQGNPCDCEKNSYATPPGEMRSLNKKERKELEKYYKDNSEVISETSLSNPRDCEKTMTIRVSGTGTSFKECNHQGWMHYVSFLFLRKKFLACEKCGELIAMTGWRIQ